MTSALCSQFVSEQSPDSAIHRDINTLRDLHPSDIAENLENADRKPEIIIEILLQVGNHIAMEAFEHLSIKTQQVCLETGNAHTMLRFIENMDPDDRVDLLKKVDVDIREAIIPLIAQAERNEIRRLWQYAEGTAGAVMTTEYSFLPGQITVGAALERLRLQSPNKETIYYIYITDDSRHLLGMISLRDLIMSKPNARLDTLMQGNDISVRHDMEVEAVAAIISKYDFLAPACGGP